MAAKTVTFDFTAGRFVKNWIVSELVRAAFKLDVQCDYRESKGLIESDFTVKLAGESGAVDRLLRW